MSAVRAVLIRPVSPNLPARRFQLGAAAPTRSDGLGGWQEVARERREALTEFIGPPVGKQDVTVRCDGALTKSVQPDVDWLVSLGKPINGTPPTFKMTGQIYLSGNVFILASMDFGDFQRDDTGVLVRQELTLHCWRYNSPELSILSSPAKQAKGGNTSSGTTSTATHSYTTKAGDSLMSIAGKLYGDPSKWPLIAKANNLRDPYFLTPGQVVKVP